MLRSIVALVLAGVVAVLAAEEVPGHMTTGTPLALQQQQHDEAAAEEHRFAQAEGDEVVAHEVDHVEKTPHVPSQDDNFVSHRATEDVKVPWKVPSTWQQEVDAADAKLNAAEEKELLAPDTVVEESTNTMTLSARCLMTCANSYGLCTRTNGRGCACAAGCMCNRGESGASCAQHCHPDNQMNFVYGYHDADHYSPHFWGKTIGDTMSDYQQVRACLDGCAKRGICKPRFCPRHPTGGFKCSECKRLQVVPASRRRGEKRYHLVEQVQRKAYLHRTATHRTAHHHHHVDGWGHVHHHVHSHTRHEHASPYSYPYRFAAVEDDAEAEAESEAEADAETDAEAESESESESGAEEGMEVHMEEGERQVVDADEAMTAAAASDALLEAQAEAEADSGYVHVVRTPFVSSVSTDGSNIQRYAPRVVAPQYVRPINGQDMAPNGPVSAGRKQDPLADKIDCNFYDCTGQQSEPYVPVGSLNPVRPYVYKPDTRTTTFSTVPDLLEPRTELKTVYVA